MRNHILLLIWDMFALVACASPPVALTPTAPPVPTQRPAPPPSTARSTLSAPTTPLPAAATSGPPAATAAPTARALTVASGPTAALRTPVATQPAPARPTPPPHAAASRGRVIYAPDQRFAASPRYGELWSMALDGSDDRKLLTCPVPCSISNLAVSPDGKQLVYAAFPPDPGHPAVLHLVNMDGTDDRVLVENVVGPELNPFSPDGTRLAIVRLRDAVAAGQQGFQQAIWVIDTGGDAPRQVTPWSDKLNAPAWIDDDHLIYDQSWAQIYRVDVRGSAKPVAIMQGGLLSLSPTRKEMLVFKGEPDSQTVTVGVVPVGGGALRLPTQWIFPGFASAWSPDGSMVALLGSPATPDAHGSLQLLRIADNAVTELGRINVNVWPEFIAWDPEGRSILYRGEGEQGSGATLRRSFIADGRAATLKTFPGEVQIAIAVVL